MGKALSLIVGNISDEEGLQDSGGQKKLFEIRSMVFSKVWIYKNKSLKTTLITNEKGKWTVKKSQNFFDK